MSQTPEGLDNALAVVAPQTAQKRIAVSIDMQQIRLVPTDTPSLLIRGWNFATAMARWAGAGMPRRSQLEIEERLAVCQSCEFLRNQHCVKCGCACVEKNRLMNKLALATEKCPLGKWE
jgi:hypothetical protein